MAKKKTTGKRAADTICTDAGCDPLFREEDEGFHNPCYDGEMRGIAGGKKYDFGKVQLSLLPRRSLKEVARVLEFGLAKYGERNSWQRVENPRQRYVDAARRHLDDYMDYLENTENSADAPDCYDLESSRHILAHAVCDLLFVLWFDLKDVDDVYDR